MPRTTLSRRRAREAAMSALYEIELGGSTPVEAINEALMSAEIAPALEAYAERLVHGVETHRGDIDAAISANLRGYTLERLAAVDRNVLRIAVFELYHVPEVPPAVTINEAIEIARKYSTLESGKFVNGVLGSALGASPKANWDPATAPVEAASEDPEPEPEIEVEELEVEADSAQAQTARRHGWTLRTEGQDSN